MDKLEISETQGFTCNFVIIFWADDAEPPQINVNNPSLQLTNEQVRVD